MPARTDCLVRFAGVTDAAEDRDTLVLATYGDLLDALGGAKLTPAVVLKTVDGGDPFHFDGDGDFGALRGNLRKLEGLIASKGWNTPAMREHLLNHLRTRAGLSHTLREKREATIVQTIPSYDLVLGYNGEYIYSPDGVWVIAKRLKDFQILDTTTRRVHTELPIDGMSVEPFFAPDGRHLIFPTRGNGQTHVPFENGKLRWDLAGQRFGPDGTGEYTRSLHATSDPNVFFGGVRGNTILRHDLATGEIKAIDLPAQLRGKAIWDRGSVPGPETLFYFMVSKDQGLRMITAHYDPKLGEFRYGEDTRILARTPKKTSVSSDGQTYFTGANVEGKVFLSPVAGGPFTPATNETGSAEFGRHIVNVHDDRSRQELVVLSEPAERGKQTKVDIVNRDTGRSRKSFLIPYKVGDNSFLSPDGNFLYFPSDLSGQLTIFNLAAKREAQP